MTKQKDIQRWVSQKLITKPQGDKIWKEVQAYDAENASNRWIGAISVIGALLLGLAAILFISSNWDAMSGGAKIVLAVLITFGSLFGGWQLRYNTQTYPRIGTAILFLSTLLIGGTYALISQVYHLDGDMWRFFLLWTVSVLPLAYMFESKPILSLGVILLLITFILFLSGANSFDGDEVFAVFASVPSFLVGLVIMYLVGSLHFLQEKWTDFGRVYRLMALKLVLFFMFLGTFQGLFGELFLESFEAVSFPKFFGGIALALGLLVWYAMTVQTDVREKRASLIGVGTLLGLLSLSAYMYLQADMNIRWYKIFDEAWNPWVMLVLLMNAWFIGVTFGLYYMGYVFKQMRLINLAIFATVVYIMARYITLFMDMMSTSSFFFVGGVLLIMIAVFAERKRRTIKQQIKNA